MRALAFSKGDRGQVVCVIAVLLPEETRACQRNRGIFSAPPGPEAAGSSGFSITILDKLGYRMTINSRAGYTASKRGADWSATFGPDDAAAELRQAALEPVRDADLPWALVPRMARVQGLIALAQGHHALARRRLGGSSPGTGTRSARPSTS